MSRGIFGGGVFSVARGRNVRMIGGPPRIVSEVGIRPLKGAHRAKDGTMSYALMEPFLPRTLREDLHHGGNSMCFAIQIAHLMGAKRIFLVGFTLQTGSGYFHGRINPVTRRSTIYQHERAIHWCRFFESKFPGRALLDPSFDGPIYSVFRKATVEELQSVQERGDDSSGPSAMSAVPQQGEERAIREEPVEAKGERSSLLQGKQEPGHGERKAQHRSPSGATPRPMHDRQAPAKRADRSTTRLL